MPLSAEPVGRAAAAFVERERGVDRVPMIFHHPARAILAARFLVGIHHQLDAAPERNAVALEREHRHQRHDSVRLVVDRAARPHVTVCLIGVERMMRPVGGDGRHHVGVRHQHQRFHAGGSGDTRDEADHAGLALESFGGDAFLVENRFEIRDCGFGVARRIGGVEAQIGAEVAERFGIDLVPIDLRRSLLGERRRREGGQRNRRAQKSQHGLQSMHHSLVINVGISGNRSWRAGRRRRF